MLGTPEKIGFLWIISRSSSRHGIIGVFTGIIEDLDQAERVKLSGH
ncbi:MAG: hypothetical protein ACREQI_08180 [Candidatus Binataceae bacterium]